MTKKIISLVLPAVLAFQAPLAIGALVNVPVPGSNVVTFDNYEYQLIGDGVPLLGPSGEAILLTATEDGILADNAHFGDNGAWPSVGQGSGTFANSSSGDAPTFRYLQFTFLGAPVSSVGGFINYCVGPYSGCATNDVSITAIGAGDEALESYNLMVAAPISMGGEYRGIQRTFNDIVAIRVSSSGTFYAIDNLAYQRVPAVPLPSSFFFMLVGGLSLFILSRRRAQIKNNWGQE